MRNPNSTPLPLVSRRQLLQAGSLGLLELSLPRLLQAGEGPALKKSPAKSCIFIYQYGGLSQLDSWDPKPNAPTEMRGPYKPISTAVPGFHVGELMPRLAKLADRYAVIRSLSHKVPVHDAANKMLLAGSSQPPSDAPSLGAIISRQNPATKNVPSHVWLQKFGGGAAPPDPSYLSGGFLGMANSPLLVGVGHDDNPSAPGFKVKALETAEGTPIARLHIRRELLSQLSGTGDPLADSHRGSVMSQFQEKAFQLLAGPEARNAFDIDKEPTAVRDRYGRHPLGQNLLMARRLIEAGVRLVSVVGWMGLAPGEKFTSVETWDMHGNGGVDIFGNGWNGLGYALPRCDEAVATLLEDLEQRGLLDSTLVVLVGEFGRTPAISRGASAIGRDHWPNCYSGMLAGAGIRGGAVYGESDQRAAYVRNKAVSPEDLGATILHALGVPPQTRLSPDGFTRPASTGEPVMELFS
ncbi:MAG: DUF1501 domain-containing protein [Planctomycetales bacterium]|nr:DUF1501 domain-containing protein [Planctomycetales bacterium]